MSPLEAPVPQVFARPGGPLTALPRALTPAERGQGLFERSPHVRSLAFHMVRAIRRAHPPTTPDPTHRSRPEEPLPPLGGGEGARQRGEGPNCTRGRRSQHPLPSRAARLETP
jgi:hypothetical protein